MHLSNTITISALVMHQWLVTKLAAPQSQTELTKMSRGSTLIPPQNVQVIVSLISEGLSRPGSHTLAQKPVTKTQIVSQVICSLLAVQTFQNHSPGQKHLNGLMTKRHWRVLRIVVLVSLSAVLLLGLRGPRLNSSLPASPYTTPKARLSYLQQEEASMPQQQQQQPTVAVIGSGLAGLSAAYELSQALHEELPQAKVVIFEKNSILGGNSAKASSGINAVNAPAGDSVQAYAADTTKSGGGFSAQELVALLAVCMFAAVYV